MSRGPILNPIPPKFDPLGGLYDPTDNKVLGADVEGDGLRLRLYGDASGEYGYFLSPAVRATFNGADGGRLKLTTLADWAKYVNVQCVLGPVYARLRFDDPDNPARVTAAAFRTKE